MNDLVVTEKPVQWVHYSCDPTELIVYDADQEPDRAGRGLFKPRGLWITPYGQRDNWFEWCRAEEFRNADLNYVHDVTFAAGANILNISSLQGLDAFSKEYAINIWADKDDMTPNWMYCDWKRLAEKYHGIIISPYQYARRMMMHGGKRNDWYYSWDCASGCIWGADAIESIKLRSSVSAGYTNKPPPDISKMMAELKHLGADI